MKRNDNQLIQTSNHFATLVSSWPSMLLARFLSLKKRPITLLLAGLCCAVFTFAFHSVHADPASLPEPIGHDVDLLKARPHSIAFHSNRDGNNEIYVMNPDGSEQTRLTFEPRSDQRADISPDGQRIVFSSNRITETNPTGDFEIFVMNTDGSDLQQLTFNEAEDSWPRWSPNGKWIAFHSSVDGNFEIYLIKANGTHLTRVTDYPGIDQFPEWSPNGKHLAIRRDTDLYLINRDGSNPIQLTAQAMINQMASWSPDGNRIAFLSTRAGYASVFVMDADGSNQVELTPKPDDVPVSKWSSRAPAWSQNGHEIYFTAKRPVTSENENIFVMNADGTGVTQLTFTAAPGVSAEAAVR